MYAQAEPSRLKLQNVFNVQKALGRRLVTRRKEIDERIAEGRLFRPDHFMRCIGLAKKALDGIMKAHKVILAREGRKEAQKLVGQRVVVNKWFINLLLLLIFSAAGQRPQVYAQLQCPTENELADMEAETARRRYIELRTLCEKTQRPLDMPHVLVPPMALTYVQFHMKHMREIVTRRAGVEEDAFSDKPLLIHTQNGEQLSTAQVTGTLKRFLKIQCPEMTNLTVMTLRSSYATMVMKQYRDEEVFCHLDEDAFLTVLSKSMNTSKEQLMTTYIGIDNADLESCARELVKNLGSYEDYNPESNLDIRPLAEPACESETAS